MGAHDLFYVGLYAGKRLVLGSNHDFIDLTLRPFTHDFSESDTGFVPYSEIHFMKTNLRFIDSKVRLESVNIAHLSLVPRNYPIDEMPAFKVELDIRSRLFNDCFDCLGGRLNLAYGISKDFFDNKIAFYAAGRVMQSHRYFANQKYHYGVGPEVGMFFNYNEGGKLYTFYSYSFNRKKQLRYQQIKVEATQSLSERFSIFLQANGSFRTTSLLPTDRKEDINAKLGLHFYL